MIDQILSSAANRRDDSNVPDRFSNGQILTPGNVYSKASLFKAKAHSPGSD
jgi:hypothetical protein